MDHVIQHRLDALGEGAALLMRIERSLILAIEKRNCSPALPPIPKSADVFPGIGVTNRHRPRVLAPKIDKRDFDFH
jgi:hypothetical protein